MSRGLGDVYKRQVKVIGDFSIEVCYKSKKGLKVNMEIPNSFVLDKKPCRDVFTLDASNSWTKIFDDLPQEGKDINGNTVTYVYGVTELTPIQGYRTIYSFVNGIPEGTLTITNKEDKSITVLKEWDENGSNYDGTHSDVKVKLFKKGENGATDQEKGTAILSASSNPAWQYTWDDLEEGTYYVKETSVKGYTTKYIFDGVEYDTASELSLGFGSSLTIKNTRELTDITVEKAWSDGVNNDPNREVQMQLYSSTTPPGAGGPVTPKKIIVECSEWGNSFIAAQAENISADVVRIQLYTYYCDSPPTISSDENLLGLLDIKGPEIYSYNNDPNKQQNLRLTYVVSGLNSISNSEVKLICNRASIQNKEGTCNFNNIGYQNSITPIDSSQTNAISTFSLANNTVADSDTSTPDNTDGALKLPDDRQAVGDPVTLKAGLDLSLIHI